MKVGKKGRQTICKGRYARYVSGGRVGVNGGAPLREKTQTFMFLSSGALSRNIYIISTNAIWNKNDNTNEKEKEKR